MGKSLNQVKWLLWKNMKIASRNKFSSIFQFISPLIVCLLVLSMQKLSDKVTSFSVVNPPITEWQPTLSKCQLPKDCITIGYGIYGYTTSDWVEYSIQALAQVNNLTLNKDIVKQYQGTNITTFNNLYSQQPNTTDMAVLFCTHPIWCQKGQNIGLGNKNLFVYNLVYNASSVPANNLISNKGIPTANRVMHLKVQLDNILINYLNSTHNQKQYNNHQQYNNQQYSIGKQQSYLKVAHQSYPEVPSRLVKGYDVMSAQGSFYFIIPPIFTFLFFVNEMLKEKELKLRQYMQVVGVSTSVFWLSWVLTIFVVSLFQALVMATSGYIFQFQFFLQTPFLVLVLLFFSFTFAMQFVGIFIVCISSSQKQGNSIAYGFLLLSWVIQILLANVILCYGLYQDVLPDWVVFIRVILTLYPPFNFSKVWGDISQYSGSHWSLVDNRYVNGNGYHWSYINRQAQGLFGDKHFITPSTSTNLLYIYMDLAIFFVVSLYFDQILAHNKGTGQNWYFIFDPRPLFNLCKPKNNAKNQDLITDLNQSGNNLTSSLLKHKKGITIKDTRKVFSTGWLKSVKNHALQGVNLKVYPGELLTLLGHNGAGKTTLIQVMTGVLQADSGSINICGLDLVTQLDQIRQVVGVCPQFDILWNELTAGEHLKLYDHLKPNNISNSSEQKYIDILRSVNLEAVVNQQVNTFSGGMKRRLSMTIAGMNSPQVVFLDEPTTGMDPVSRRQIWEMVLQLKKDKVVLLTTHSMEEADVLSDQVAIMVEGQIKCSATSLELKNTYGKGYRLSLIVQSQQEQMVLQHIHTIIPNAILVDQSASNIVLAVHHTYIHHLRDFVLLLEQEYEAVDQNSKDFKMAIKEWGVSNATLEEVFMAVTNKKQQKQLKKE